MSKTIFLFVAVLGAAIWSTQGLASARVSSNGEIDVRHAMRQSLPKCMF